MPSVRSWHRSASFDSDSSKLNSGRESMSDLTRRDVLKAGVAATAVAAGGGMIWGHPAAAPHALHLEPGEGGTALHPRRGPGVHGDRDQRSAGNKKVHQTHG